VVLPHPGAPVRTYRLFTSYLPDVGE